MALMPKIKTGIYSGKIKRDNNTPLRLAPRVRAAPMEPIRLNVGVPMKRLNIRTGKPPASIFNSKARQGAATIRGRPVVNQCVVIFAATMSSRAKG